MAYDSKKPTNDGYLAEFPPEMREQLRAIINDQIVDALKLVGLSPGNLNGNIPVSNGTLCNNLNADKLDGNDAAAFAAAGHTHGTATTSSNGFMSNTDKAKLNGIFAGAEVNQNAFSNVKVGTTTIQADNVTDTLELVPGANIALTPDATNDRVTVAVTGTVASAATCTGNAATASACSGNAATATKLQTVRTIALTGGATGSGSFDGSGNLSIATTLAGNAPTATKLQTARTISLTGTVTGSGSFDGSANISIATSGGIPPGMIAWYPKSSPPTGWLECNGAAISRTTYAALFAVVGTTFGSGDGSTTFGLPDFRGEFIRGWDHGRGVDTDRAIGSSQSDELKSHNHAINYNINAAWGGGSGAAHLENSTIIYNLGSIAIQNTGGSETRPRNVALLPCIKY